MFTKGPWVIVPLENTFGDCVGLVIEDCDGNGFAQVEDEDKANLIAAAPDMYAALERTVALYEDEAPIMAADLREVMAKARGEI